MDVGPPNTSWNTRCLQAGDTAGAGHPVPLGPLVRRVTEGRTAHLLWAVQGLGLQAARHPSGGLEVVKWAGLLVQNIPVHICPDLCESF